MSKKKVAIVLVCLVTILINIGILNIERKVLTDNITLSFNCISDQKLSYQLFYSSGQEQKNLEFKEELSSKEEYNQIGSKQKVELAFKSDSNYLRIDFGEMPVDILLSDFCITYKFKEIKLADDFMFHPIDNNMVELKKTEEGIHLKSSGEDSYLIIEANGFNGQDIVSQVQSVLQWIKNIAVCLTLDLLILLLLKFSKKLAVLPVELYRNRRLILKLAKNDFKTRFAGSYLGIVWAFIQPIVTVVVYWFVFQVGLRSGNVGDFPFVLWLVAGLVPWFFFSEALSSGTNALIEYNYLVKKVVFKISILPIIKVISALFVHAFFLGFTLILFACYGYYPDLYTLQVLYFTFCMFILVLGLSYATCAIVIFFRDLTQIISIILQIGVWMTPIMWNIEILPEKFRWIFKLNPMYYIVDGYRNALIYKQWFWNDFYSTMYFWLFAAAAFGFGALMFKRLKVHFADVL